SEILKDLKRQGGKYIPTHSTLLSYLACGIASQMKWGSETTFHKLNLAAFLHDIQLKNQELAEMNTLAEAEEAKKFTPEELKAYKTHPIEAAAAAKEFTEVPPDVDTIIVQHHERPDGTGFPRGLTHTYIAPLAAVFIVAHELTQYALKHPNDFDTQKFIELNGGRYKSSQFKKVLSVIEGLHLVKGLAADVPGSKKI
ncbi:MAG: HD-GYP domain-containing protein, partial [Bdellovibrionota bacterium]